MCCGVLIMGKKIIQYYVEVKYRILLPPTEQNKIGIHSKFLGHKKTRAYFHL